VPSRKSAWALAAACLAGCLALGSLYLTLGWYPFNVIMRRGGSVWVTIVPSDSRISKSMQLALRTPPPAALPGPFGWTLRADGFETAELPVIADGQEVDRILLARIDPNKFRFEVRNRPAGNYELSDWMKGLAANLVVNGSYFERDGAPSTPFLSDGAFSGPKNYQAMHGAFIASGTTAEVRDLQSEDWRDLFRQSRFGMVSYPLLVGPGPSRVRADPRWLANRTFVGQDSTARILVGTTQEAFFSLDRLALFLRQAPLDLTLALNLDGGPVACQGVSINGFSRDFCGEWETKFEGGDIKLLRPLLGSRRWGLPIVLAVFPR
jgi:hypothetical protein